ncbi:uncharacterized protein TRIADDRAFT_26095 [Trichoplax adhaerens]|uniref:Centrosomal protein of 44 kDa n=1 Tax=Trichoplax adhaerens TaxID=10228 RepID=B3RYR5_TRIAD|nr:hypothetical protein TRIADDRAFT_26095 [Trichoplax adhaerens]EDV25088.1 hypothetical protein TRIADDRAFT_26095 [Trichoplax adhaerens]|eukprot:XP_002112978.1 hypothetical protein TRIADDRAFT_26095 [Trichoplax adhaerens]
MKSAIVKTGDIKNNIRILQSLVQRAGFKDRIDYASIAKGIPTAFLPLLHFLLTEYSVELSKYLLDNGFEFFSKNDLRFIEETFKVLRKIFNYKPTISIDQFFTVGFSERKVILTCDLARICIDKNKELTRYLGIVCAIN